MRATEKGTFSTPHSGPPGVEYAFNHEFQADLRTPLLSSAGGRVLSNAKVHQKLRGTVQEIA